MSDARLFLQQVEALVEAADATAEELRESGFGYMAQRLERALADLANAPRPLQINPEPLEVVERRDNVSALAAIRGRSRGDRLRVWLALGGTEEDFPDA